VRTSNGHTGATRATRLRAATLGARSVERFRQRQAEQKKDAELDEALAAVLGAQEVAGEPPHHRARGVEAVLAASENEKASDDDTTSQGERETARVVPEALVERMLVDLKIEETATTKEYKVVSSVVSGLLLVGGLGFVIWSALLFARTRTTEGLWRWPHPSHRRRLGVDDVVGIHARGWGSVVVEEVQRAMTTCEECSSE